MLIHEFSQKESCALLVCLCNMCVSYVAKCITGPYKPAPNMLLMFYAYYKQATVGPCNRPKPWSFDVINKAKWDAWNKLGNMSKETAMENYVTELKKVSL